MNSKTFTSASSGSQVLQIAYNPVHAKVLNADRALKLELSSLLSYEVEGAQFTEAFKEHRWDGRSSFYDFRSETFPSGFVHPVHSHLIKSGRKVQLIRKPLPQPRGPENPKLDELPDDPRYAYQMDTVRRLERYGQMIARVATGGGKSRIARLATARIDRPTLFLTTRSVLMYQMAKAFKADHRSPGILGDGHWRPRPGGVSCGMVQTIAARLGDEITRRETEQLLASFEFVILEEAHESGGNTYYDIMSLCKNAAYRLALTATPFMRIDAEANMRLMGCSGPIGIDIPEKQLIDCGILARPTFKITPTEKPKDVFRTTGWQNAYQRGIVLNKSRNESIVNEAKRAARMGMSVMILVQRKQHGNILRSMLQDYGVATDFIYGENDQEEREKALAKIKSGKLSVLIGSTILDVGVDVPAVGMIILAGAGKAEVAFRQRIGRGLRAKKKGANVAYIVDFADDFNVHLHEHALQRVHYLKSTPGFAENVLPVGADFDFREYLVST